MATPTTKPIFHRGDTTGAEENTMPAFKAAAARGRGFEFDIHPTADATFAVVHDPTWDRTCKASTIPAGSPRVAATTQDQVNAIRTFGGRVIPNLKQVMALTAQGAAPCLIDFKTADPWPAGMIERLDQIVDDVNAHNRCFLFLTDRVVMGDVRAAAPHVRLSWRPVDEPYDLATAFELGVSAIQPALDTVANRAAVAKYQAAGLRVICQDRGINSRADLDRVRNLGFDYVLIDADKWDRWT
jgi:glycerophosphoryl diester phosphodiesterase